MEYISYRYIVSSCYSTITKLTFQTLIEAAWSFKELSKKHKFGLQITKIDLLEREVSFTPKEWRNFDNIQRRGLFLIHKTNKKDVTYGDV